ncbi:MAG: CpsB/CapC family capsule biosynthesis tyrosine phosphatase [Bacteroidales bacterium]
MGFWDGLFNQKSQLQNPLRFDAFKVDMHSHLIPGIDDGVKTLEESVAMIRGLQDLGFEKLITTPHVMADTYRNTTDTIESGVQGVRKSLRDAGIAVEIEAAAEYMLDDNFPALLKKQNLLTIGRNFLLVEMSYFSEPLNLDQLLFDVQVSNYKVILAHPERYSFWYNRKDRYQDMLDRQVHLQLNLLSLAGYYGKDVQKMAGWLLDNDMYSFVGTDLHNDQYLKALKDLQYLPVVEKLMAKSEQFLNSQL